MIPDPEPTLVEYFHYTHWANRTLFEVCATLDAALMEAAIPGSYGPIVQTCLHLLRAQASFLKRLRGVAPEPPFSWDARPTFAEVLAFEDVLAAQLLDVLHTVPATTNVHEEGQGW